MNFGLEFASILPFRNEESPSKERLTSAIARNRAHWLDPRAQRDYYCRTMKCPHCLESFHEQQSAWSIGLGSDVEGEWIVTRTTCPACNKFVLSLIEGPPHPQNRQAVQGVQPNAHWGKTLFRPKGISRTAVPAEVPKEIVEDYKEA